MPIPLMNYMVISVMTKMTQAPNTHGIIRSQTKEVPPTVSRQQGMVFPTGAIKLTMPIDQVI